MKHPFWFQRRQVILIGSAGILTVLAVLGPPSLVLPPLIIGLVFLWLSQCERIRNNGRLQNASLSVSAWGLILASGLIIANLAVALWTQSRGSPSPVTRKSQYSNRRHLYQTGAENKLGFVYTPSQIIHAKLWREKGSSTDLAYSAKYTIDQSGNRKTCLGSQSQSLSSGPTVLFIGDSFTMGEGLGDCETLPSLFAKVSGLQTTNAAMNGYGTHQALKLLEDDRLLRSRIGARTVSVVVYRMIREHLQRSSGKSPWDAYGPCYQLNQTTQQLQFKGPFSQCIGIKKVVTLLAWTAANELMKSNEPLTYRLGSTLSGLLFAGLKRPIDLQAKRLFVAMMARMKYHALRNGAPLIVVFEDNDPDCHPDGIAEDLVAALGQLRIPLIRGSTLVGESDCLASKYTIPGDGHPNRGYNLLLADHLYHHFFQPPSRLTTP